MKLWSLIHSSYHTFQMMYQHYLAPHYLQNLVSIADSLRVDPSLSGAQRKTIQYHQKQLNLLEVWSTILFLVLAALYSLAVRFLVPYAPELSTNTLLLFVTVYGLYILVLLPHRMLLNRLSQHYAESMAIGALIYSLMILADENALSTQNGKKQVQHFLHLAVISTWSLGHTLPAPNPELRKHALTWMGGVAAYLLDREGWILTPQVDTVKNLRKDLTSTLTVMLSGQYDDFKIYFPNHSPSNIENSPPSRARLFLGYLIGIGGVILGNKYSGELGLTSFMEHDLGLLLFVTIVLLISDAVTGAGIVERIISIVNKLRKGN